MSSDKNNVLVSFTAESHQQQLLYSTEHRDKSGFITELPILLSKHRHFHCR